MTQVLQSAESTPLAATLAPTPCSLLRRAVGREVLAVPIDAVREILEVGRLTEEFFPEHDIRLVAVSDNIDTA